MEDEKLKELSRRYNDASELEDKVRAGFHICLHLYNTLKHDALHQFAPEVLKLAVKLERKEFYLSILNLLGVASKTQGNFDQAKEYYYKMITYAQRVKTDYADRYIALGYQNLALTAMKQSNMEEFFDLSFKAKDIFEKDIPTYADNLINLYLNVAEGYLKFQKYDLAKEYLKKAYNIEKRNGFPDRSYQVLGNFYTEQKDYTLALGYLKRSLAYYLQRNDIPRGITVLYFIAGQYYNSEKYEKAINYLFQLQDLAQKYKLKQYNFQLHHYLGSSYYKLNSIRKANKHFNLCLNMISDVKDNKLIMKFYSIYIDYLEQKKEYKKACYYYKIYTNVFEKENNDQLLKSITVKTAEYELEQKKSEAKILADKNKIIESQNDQLLKMQEAKDNLMYTISHDLKNILGATNQAHELFLLKQPTFKEDKYIKIATTSNSRALSLVGEILYSSKLDAKNDTLNMHKEDINEVLSEYAEQMLMRCKNKDINLVYEYSLEPLLVMIDKEKWYRIFENLCTNAIKFTHPGGEINIKTKQLGQFASISIKDSGVGIPADSIPKLFLPFSKVGRKGTAGEESTGLGLSIVKKLVELHNGTVDVNSEEGKGTEFIIKLPIVAE